MINVLWLLLLFVAIPLKAEIQTKEIGQEGPNFLFYRYNDATMKVKEVCAVMNPASSFNVCFQMQRGGGQGAPIANLFFPNPINDPLREVCVAVPQTGQNSITLFINSKGIVDGFNGLHGPFNQNTLNQDPLTPCLDF